MRWIPPWLAKAYATIYAEKGTDVFDFSEAGIILGIRDERPLAKTLARLKRLGHLTVRRDPVDPRRKLFRLIDPRSVTLALAIQSRAESSDLLEKLRAASGVLDYYVNGAYAAYQYHRYSAPGSVDVSVKAEQLPIWIALLSEKEVAISVDGVPAERPSSVNVRLHSDFQEDMLEHTKVIERIRYLSPELLIIKGLAQDRPSLEDALAILISQSRKLDLRRLLALSDAYNIDRYFGCVLDILNFESRKSLFGRSLIDRIFRKSNLQVKLDFPSKLSAEPLGEHYATISSKWNLRIHLSRAVVSKIVTDLVRA